MLIRRSVSHSVGNVMPSLTAMIHLMKRTVVCCHILAVTVTPEPTLCIVLETCPLGFLCSDKHCIAEYQKCDGQGDCKNGEDEQICGKFI